MVELGGGHAKKRLKKAKKEGGGSREIFQFM